MTRYSISDSTRPWVVLFSSSSLEAVAEAIAAQQELDPSSIYATLDGRARSLSESERIVLFECVLVRRPGDPVAMAEIARARHAANG